MTAYVIDTGIQLNHPDFSPAATNGFDAFGGTGEDCNGHGTHVAGAIARNLSAGFANTQVLTDATSSKITSVPRKTINKLLYLAPTR